MFLYALFATLELYEGGCGWLGSIFFASVFLWQISLHFLMQKGGFQARMYLCRYSDANGFRIHYLVSCSSVFYYYYPPPPPTWVELW